MDNEEMVMMSKMIITCFYTSNQTNNRNFTPSVQGEYTVNCQCSEHVEFINSKEDCVRGEKVTACFGIPLT